MLIGGRNTFFSAMAGLAHVVNNASYAVVHNIGFQGVVHMRSHTHRPDGVVNCSSAAHFYRLDLSYHYGMKPVEDMLKDYEFDSFVPKTKTDFLRWWEQQEKVPGTDNIILKDKLGNKILFDSNLTGKTRDDSKYFKTHIFKNNDQRWKYADTFPEIISDPDEIWSYREKGD